MAEPLLQTKLHIPPPRSGLVPRNHLITRLNRGLQPGNKLTLISAPPGFGKTTLVREWAGKCGQPVAWISLDEEDSDPVRLLTYLVAGLQTIHTDIGNEVLGAFRAPQPPPLKTAVAALINEISALPDQLVLVLDDYHLIKAETIHNALAFLLENKAPQLHLVIITREDPPVPLPRWRARGELVELRETDLRFTVDEATSFLNDLMKLNLTSSQIELLGNKTEGWVAGLQLAALSMRGQADIDQFVRSFAGSNRYVLDYLIEEVFRQQPPAVREFLLQTAILEQLTAPLCDTILAGGKDSMPDSQAMLEQLERANLFLIPLDETRRWFRYHHLFADLLRQRLQREKRDVTALHRRAGEWHERADFPRRAISHYLAAHAWEQAAALVHRQSEQLQKSGENATFLRWMEALPYQVIRSNPDLCLEYAWALALTGRPDEADSYLMVAEKAMRDNPRQYGKVLSAQIHVARTRHDLPQTIELSRRALSLIPVTAHDPRSALSLNLGIAHWHSGQILEAESAFSEAQNAAGQTDNHHIRLLAIGFLSMVQAARGRLQKAAALLENALKSDTELPVSSLPHLVLGALLYERNQLEEADAHLNRAVTLAQRSGNVELESSAHRQIALLKQAQGNHDVALAAVARATETGGDTSPPITQARNCATAIVIALAQNDLTTAQRWAARMQAPASASLFFAPLHLAPARLYLAQGNKRAATEHLDVEFEKAKQGGWRYGQIEIHLLQALAASRSDDAVAFLANALALAHGHGFVRTFLDKGEELIPLLHIASSAGSFADDAQSLLAVFEESLPSLPVTASPERDHLVEAISERELEVLQLLAQGHTYQEIAQTLVISVNTVKSHLKTIYGKLGVGNRREAVAQARALHLLDADR